MTTRREQLNELLSVLSDDQIETVLSFTEALSQGRVVVSVCDAPGADVEATHPPDVLIKDVPARRPG